jgi:ATP-dependent DNA ligase
MWCIGLHPVRREMSGDKPMAKLPITHRDLAAPTNRARAFNDPAWVWELKHDGYRALLIKDGPRTSLLTRRQRTTKPLPRDCGGIVQAAGYGH